MIPHHDNLLFGVWLATGLIAVLFGLMVLCGVVYGELPPGMHLTNEVRIDTLWQPHRTRYSAALDSMIRADSTRPRQRLNKQDSLWLELK